MHRFWKIALCLFCFCLVTDAQEYNTELAGENPAIYLADGYDWPLGTVEQRQSSDLWASSWQSRWQFGIPQDGQFAAGIELFNSYNRPDNLYAPASGFVIFADEVFPFGKIIILRHDPLFTTAGIVTYTRYLGMSHSVVEAGQHLQRGELLGEVQSQFEFAIASSDIFESNPSWQPESQRDVAPFFDPYEFIAEHRPRQALQTNPYTLPVSGDISQDYSERHPAIDIDAIEGSPILAMTEGLVIRNNDCVNCERVFPCHWWHYQDAALGFGYGNFLIIRYERVLMPPELREIMAAYHARYAYLLYAHMVEMFLDYGDSVAAGTSIGRVGISGCVSAPALHLELRIGNAESVDGVWQQQTPLDPFILFQDAQ